MMKVKTDPPELADTAIVRILEKVKEAGGTVPDYYFGEARLARQARKSLAFEIALALTNKDRLKLVRKDTGRKATFEALGRVNRAATVILDLTRDEKLSLDGSLGRYFPPGDDADPQDVTCPRFDELLSGLRRLHDVTKQQRARLKRNIKESPPPDGRRKQKPIYVDYAGWLTGLGKEEKTSGIEVWTKELPFSTAGEAFMFGMAEAYWEFFGDNPRIKYDSEREPTGPFVAFVQAVSQEIGHPMGPVAIRKALERAGLSDKDWRKL